MKKLKFKRKRFNKKTASSEFVFITRKDLNDSTIKYNSLFEVYF